MECPGNYFLGIILYLDSPEFFIPEEPSLEESVRNTLTIQGVFDDAEDDDSYLSNEERARKRREKLFEDAKKFFDQATHIYRNAQEIEGLIRKYCGDTDPRTALREHIPKCTICLPNYRGFLDMPGSGFIEKMNRLFESRGSAHRIKDEYGKRITRIEEQNRRLLNLPLELILT